MPAEAESLHLEIESLKAKFRDTKSAVPAQWKLTPTEERIFRVLLSVEIATRDAVALGAEVKSPRTQNVHVSRLRAKLAPFQVEIETVQRKGWRLVSREAWRSLLITPLAS